MEKNLPQVDLCHLPRCAGEFIKLVIKKMRYRRKVRVDVLAELASDFEEELKEYTSDEQKQQKARQLIDEFGDVKLLAVLLRRAKKRCRPLWRTVAARSFQAVGVLILCFILYVVWFLTGKPVITTDYVSELNRIVRPAADESLNAAPLYHKATELVEKSIADEVTEVWGKKYKDATLEEKQVIEKQLTDNEEILELVIAGTQKPYHWQKYGNRKEEFGMVGILLPNLSEFRGLAFALRSRAQLRAEQGRYEDALDDTKSCYRFGQHLRGDKFLIEQLVGIAIEALAVQTIRNIVVEYEIDSNLLADLQRDFEQIVAEENFAISLKAERLSIYDEIQRCFTADRIGKGHLYLPRFTRISNLYLAGSHDKEEGFEYFILGLLRSAPVLFGHPNKQETLDSTNELFDYCLQLCLKNAAQRHAQSDEIDHKLKEILSDNIFLDALAPSAVRRVIGIGNRVPTEVGATLTIIAILRYRRDTDEYPQNLNQLAADDYLKQLPMDSFADKPLSYRKTEDNFVLYSFGPNFKDDGGVSGKDTRGRARPWRDNGDTVFWPVPKSQTKQ